MAISIANLLLKFFIMIAFFKKSQLCTFYSPFVLFFIFFTFLSLNTYAQSKYKVTKQELQEFRVGLGATYTQWLNSTYNQKFQSKDITASPGFSILMSRNYFPFKIDAILFDSHFKTKEDKYRFTGFELGSALQLNPFFKTIMPYVGIAYQKAVLGNGFLIYGIKDEDSDDPLNVMKINGFYTKVGIDFNFRKFGINLEYKNSFIKNFHNEQFCLFLFYKYN